MNSLSDLLKNSRISSPMLRGVKAASIIELTNKVLEEEFGKEIKELASPAYFRGGNLTIACLSSVTAQEIRLREKEILDKLNYNSIGVFVKKISYLT